MCVENNCGTSIANSVCERAPGTHLHPLGGTDPSHVGVDEPAIRLGGGRYRLNGTVDPEIDPPDPVRRHPTKRWETTGSFRLEGREKAVEDALLVDDGRFVDDARLRVDGTSWLQRTLLVAAADSSLEHGGTGALVEHV